MAQYEIWIKELKRHEQAIKEGQPCKVDLRDESLQWKPVEAVISYEPIEGGVEVTVVGEGGPVSYVTPPVYVKIVRELDEDEAYVIHDMTKYQEADPFMREVKR
jgi:hypothetical protein